MATLGGVSLGDIQTEAQTKDSGLFNMPLPASDSTSTLLLDLFGTTRTITLDGKFVGTTTEINTFISAIEGIQNGSQSGSAYIGDLVTTSKNVFIQSFNWNYTAGDTNKISYNLTLIEGLI